MALQNGKLKSGTGFKDKIKSIFKKNKSQRNSVIIENTEKLPTENSVILDGAQKFNESTESTKDAEDKDEVEINEDVVRLLFEGAPQFSVTGDDEPNAAFPWDTNLIVRDATDYVFLEHPAFSLSTARSHLVPGLTDNRGLVEYNIGTVEIPSMLSSQGTEPGSVGFVHFLEESISDALNGEQTDDLGQNSIYDGLENAETLQSTPEKLGIRKFNLELIGERLIELAGIYDEYRSTAGKIHLLKKQTPGELYSMLFTQILTPPNYDSSASDPTGIKVQIQVLLRILKLKSIWFDLSSVEWRIRIGQILWTDVLKQDATVDEQEEELGFSERNILILQMTLACELLLRLDAVSAISTQEVEGDIQLTRDEILEFRKRETKKTRWDLLLARSFLRNVEVRMARKQITITAQPSRAKSIFTMGSVSSEKEEKVIPAIAFVPKNLEQQLSGLFHWTKVLSWPDRELVEEQLRAKLMAHASDMENLPVPSVYTTPVQTPRSVMSGLSSYFDARPDLSRSTTPRSFQLLPTAPSPNSTPRLRKEDKIAVENTLVGGWLTRTYITGLVLPGEAISHFLIASLLENDVSAIARLGDSACLYGGIVYRNRSWWSKSCIVGRVMAAVKGARECMGWVYLPKAPKNAKDGWYDIESAPLEIPEVPRIKQSEELAKDAAFLAGKSAEDILPQDLVVPADATESPSSTMWFDALYLKPIPTEGMLDSMGSSSDGSTSQMSAPILPAQSASLRFASGKEGENGPELHIPLLHLIQFISAFPCFPPTGQTSKVFKQSTEHELNAHPLHTSHTFRIIKANDLFSDVGPEPGTNLETEPTEPQDIKGQEVTVINARHDATLELLARAYCSWKGENAVIGRVNVTCLACCVREARALGAKIIIRVE